MLRSFAPVLAPLFFGAGKTLSSDKLVAIAGRLDPLFARAFIYRMARNGLDLDEIARFSRMPQFIASMKTDCSNIVRNNYSYSRAQLFQDLFVVLASEEKQGGFFVEVGVGNGEYLSNTFLLEKKFAWRGILVEPSPTFHKSIVEKRTAILDTRAAFSRSGQRMDLLVNSGWGEISTLEQFRNSDTLTRSGITIPVTTVTLDDLLIENRAPTTIDYISIDTEGSEYEVLKGLDFDKTKVLIFSIESNYNREKLNEIEQLLIDRGYRVLY